MRRTLLLLLVVLLPVRGMAEPFSGRSLNQPLVAAMMTTALEALEPRILEPVPMPRLALWALGGLASLDARLQPDLQDGTLRLVAPGLVLFARVPPAPDDAAGWGEAIAQMVRAAWDGSEAVREAGTQRVIAALLDELTSHLDPYSRYAPPAEAEAERARRAGAGGIGAQLLRRRGSVVLVSVLPGGPAASAGARDGDAVLAIDGEPTEGEELERLTARLAGPEQTGVVLTLRRRGEPPREVEIVRALIPPRTVTAERRGDLLLLRVSGFAADTGARMAQALADAAGNPHRPRGVVIDLRGNRGGLLAQAVAAAEVVIPEGVVATTAGRHPAAAHVFVAHGADLTAGLPVVVLVDGSSASAAEILAAALADQHRAVVVGSATLGKGLVQTIVQLPDGGALLISWSRVLAPLGWPLQGLGVLPQVCTSLGPAALERQLRALAHGAQPMAAALERQRGARPPLAPDEVLAIRAACPAAVGRESDWLAAERLLHDPKAYAAALLGPPPPSAGAANALAVSTP